jgi:hypothetical protein
VPHWRRVQKIDGVYERGASAVVVLWRSKDIAVWSHMSAVLQALAIIEEIETEVKKEEQSWTYRPSGC